jgi:gamma-glutamyltranspeptidase / glutathione hydrolase
MKNNFLKSLAVFFALFFFTACLHQKSEITKGDINLSDTWIGEPSSGFRELKAVGGKEYMIASAHELSSKAGEEMLAKGGSAIDAAIAAQMVLTVVEPHSSGIGGGGFLLYFDKKTGQTVYFNGREIAPAKAHERMFLDKDGKPRQFNDAVRGGLSVGVPGLLKVMRHAHKSYGKLTWRELFQPAIKIAREGFVVSERFNTLSTHVSYLKDFDETAEIYLNKNGQPFQVGEIVKNPKLANTLEKIANKGTISFYEGKIAQDIVNAVQKSKINPGYLSFDDLKNYKIRKGDLICASYRKKYKICTMPLPAGGSTLLQILGILENFDLAKLKPNSAEVVHLIVEATRLAYADRNEYVADVKNVPLKQMLNKNYLKSRASLIDVNKAIKKVEAGKFSANDNKLANSGAVELPSTTHMSVIDAEGNAVSLTSSIEYFFGSAISVDGFLLNNQMTDFSFIPEKNGKKVANRVEPYKQPRSSMSPSLIFDEKGDLIMVVGSPGGPRIIQFVAKEIINHLDFGLDVQQSASLPSFVVLNDIVELEENQNITKLKSALLKMGHETKIVPIVSGINAITINKNKIQGGTDPRREGVAVGK